MKTITPLELNQRLNCGSPAHLIDVRTAPEYEQLRVPGVSLEPLDSLNPACLAARLAAHPAPLYVFCRSGSRANRAIGKLEKAGLANCVLVEGGIMAWQAAGLPVVIGRPRVISLERQVRIAAGALVLVGTLLGVFWTVGFLALPGLVGGGLVFAGVTDRCSLALVLARLPWNRATTACPAGCSPTIQPSL